jgi:PAS domain S-box-containing protein
LSSQKLGPDEAGPQAAAQPPPAAGEMAARIRAFDWSTTPLGPAEGWPAELRLLLSVCLNSGFPSAVYWGPDFITFYNDAWAAQNAGPHPWGLGRPARESRADMWHVIGSQFLAARETGKGWTTSETLLPMKRGADTVDTWWSYSITPIAGDDGQVLGILTQGWEVTGQRAAREERDEQVARMREMFQQAPGSVAVLHGPDHVYEVANESYMELVGYRDVIGKPLAEALPEVVEQGFITVMDQVYRTGEPFVGKGVKVSIARAADGEPEERILDFVYQPIRNAKGRVTDIFVEATDVTERVRAEAEVRAQAERMQALFAHVPSGMVLLRGPEHRYEVVNNAYLQLIGARDNIIGRSVAEAVPEAAAQGFIDILDRVYRTGESWSAEGAPIKLQRAADAPPEERLLNLLFQPDRDAEGNVAGVLVHCLDVTDQRRADAARRASDEQRRLATEAARIGVWEYDPATDNLVWDDRCNELWGVPAGAAVTYQGVFMAGLHPDDREPTQQAVERALNAANPKGYDVEYRVLGRDDGIERWINAKGQAVFSKNGGSRFVGTVVDITERKRAEEQLRAYADRRVFIDALSDRLRDRRGPEEVAAVACERLGPKIGVNVCGYGEAEASGEHFDVAYCWTDGAMPPLAGRLTLDDFGKALIDEMRAGRAIRLADPLSDVRTRGAENTYAAVGGMRAGIAVPIMRNGRFVAAMFAVQVTPREWTDDDEALMAEAAERTWAAMERARAAAAIRESEERFRLVAESAPVMLWMGDAKGGCVYLNRAQREFWGAPENGIASFSWSSTLHPEDAEKLSVPFSKGMAEQRGFSVEARYQRFDGVWRLMRTEAQPRFGPNGEFLGMIGVNVDVTDTREAEAALLGEKRRLEILNRTGAAVAAELDLGRVVQSITDAGVELTGAAFGAFFYNVLDEKGGSYMLYSLSGVDRSHFDKFPMPRATKVFEPTFKGEGVIRSDDILEDARYGHNPPHAGMPEGHLPVRSYLAVPVVSRSGEVHGGLFFGHPETGVFRAEHEELLLGIAGQAAVAIDNARLFRAAELEVAERRRAEAALQDLNATLETRIAERTEELHRAEDSLRQAQKMEAVGQLTGGIAHDFNNMLAVVIGGLNLLQRRLAKGDTNVAQYVEGAMEGARRAASLTQRLLAFSRQSPLAPEAIDPNRMVAEMSELLRRTLGEDVRVEPVLSAGLWKTYADALQLENAILNLAVNARDAMPAGGRLMIETGNAHVDEDYAKEFGIGAGQYVLIAVTDTGEGMTQETIARAFDPFFTTKGVGKGTGLGLSQVFGFLRQSGGHVKIYSEIGQGTTVKMYLPRYYGEAVAAGVKRQAGPVRAGRPEEVVLVVEDEERVRAFSTDALKELGYTVISAASGPEALRILDSGANVTLIFTDVMMPDMTGRQLAELAVAKKPNLKVLYTTGYTRNAVVHNGVLDPGTHFLAKPFGIDQLAAKVRDVLDA